MYCGRGVLEACRCDGSSSTHVDHIIQLSTQLLLKVLLDAISLRLLFIRVDDALPLLALARPTALPPIRRLALTLCLLLLRPLRLRLRVSTMTSRPRARRTFCAVPLTAGGFARSATTRTRWCEGFGSGSRGREDTADAAVVRLELIGEERDARRTGRVRLGGNGRAAREEVGGFAELRRALKGGVGSGGGLWAGGVLEGSLRE